MSSSSLAQDGRYGCGLGLELGMLLGVDRPGELPTPPGRGPAPLPPMGLDGRGGVTPDIAPDAGATGRAAGAAFGMEGAAGRA